MSWLKKTCLLAAAILTSSAFSYAQDFPEPYCDVTFDYDIEPISVMQFADIDNPTDATVDGTPAIEDFTDIIGNVAPGATYSITLDGHTGGSWTDYFYVYADWNQDGDFDDDGESYAAGSIYASIGDGTDPAVTDITVPSTALSGETRMRVLKVYDLDEDPGSCSSPYGYGQAEDYTLNVESLDCTFPEATYSIVPNCSEGEFSVEVTLTSLGDASTIELKEGDESLTTFSSAGSFTAGPFSSGSSHTFTLVHSGDAGCTITSSAQTYVCPPDNDDCSGAVTLTVNEDASCSVVTSGSTEAATESMEGCLGTADDDVWYSFEATAAIHTVTLSNIVGGYEDMMIEVFDGCGGSSLECSDPESVTLTGLTIGNTYYVRVYTYDSEDYATFDICIGSIPSGGSCDDPIVVSSIPYTTDDNTANYGNLYSGSPGSSCGTTSSYLGGYDAVYSYTATAGGSINIELIPDESWVGMFVYSSCDDIGVSCADGSVNGSAGGNINIDDFPVTSGSTYYIVISTWPDPETTGYTLNITEGASCVAPSDLMVDDFSATSAMVSWSSDGTEFELEWGDEGFTPGEGTLATGISGTSYTIDGLSESSSYDFYVRNICGTGESEWSGPYTFTVPGEGATCGNPLMVTGLPYTTDDNTENYGDYYSGTPGDACSDYNYLNGYDVVYAYTPEESGNIDVELLPTEEWAGIFIYTSCDDIGVNCIGGGVNEDSSDPININEFAVTAGTTYYFVISTWPDPETTAYTLNISQSVVAATGIGVGTEGDVPAEINIDDGTLQMTAAITPAEADQAVTWSIVPGTGTATISETGLVAALTNGTVWAKAVSVSDATFADSVEITITNQVQPVASVEVSVYGDAAAEITAAAGTLQMVATVLPVEAYPEVDWSIVPGTGTATISASGLVTASGNGTVWAKAVSVSDPSKTDSLLVTLSNQDVGMEQVINALGFSIHPNPANDAVYLQMQHDHPQVAISLTDINGRIIINQDVKANGLKSTFKLDVASLLPGVYMINIAGDSINIVHKLVKN